MVPSSNNKTLYLIDGSGFIFRAYHSLPPMSRADGTPVGAVYGFTNMLHKLTANMGAHYLAVVFDAARKTFRNDIYPEYKAHRPPAPDDLVPQFAIVREATTALNIRSIELLGYEADDVIATLAMNAISNGFEVVVVSADKDLMQLVQPGLTLYDPMKSKNISDPEVLEKFGVPPVMLRDLQALMGDASDNIPGVPGIGPKTAAELLNKFGTLDGVYENLHNIPQAKRRQTLEDNRDKAYLSYQLVTLKRDVPIEFSLSDFEYKKPDNQVLGAFLMQQGFKSLAARFGATPVPISEAAIEKPEIPKRDFKYSIIRTQAALTDFIIRATKDGIVAFDIETDGLSLIDSHMVGFSMALQSGESVYVPVAHVKFMAQGDLLGNADVVLEKQIKREDALAVLRPFLADKTVLKIGQNIKFDMGVLHKYGVTICPYDDTMLMSYSMHAGKNGHGMDELAELHLNHKTIKYSEVTGTGKARINFAEVEIEKAAKYAAEDAFITMELYKLLQAQLLAEKCTSVYHNFERPLLKSILAMELAGVQVDKVILNNLSLEFHTQMERLAIEIYKYAGREFNIGSPKQLGEILFDELAIKGGKKSAKTGAYETGAEILEELNAMGFEIAGKVLEWRQLAKLKSTYADALDKEINPQTGRVHTSFSLAATTTGRLSSNNPNLQNIPIRTVEGRRIRTAFTAPSGCKILSADYSQIELRLLAHIADIAPLKQAFKNGQDIHSATAAEIFGMDINNVDAEARRRAKTINFGIIYGISAFGLASRLGISNRESADFIAAYFARYPGIKEYMDKTREFARSHGYVETIYGRRCYINGINDKNGAVRSFSERAAINAPIQGAAADVIKMAMIDIYNLIENKQLSAKMLLQVHDELLFEVDENNIEESTRIIKKTMQNVADLSVPMLVEVGSGNNWGESH